MTLTDSYITLKGLRFHAKHGVLPQENSVGGEYTVDLRVDYDASKAMQSDSVNDAVNYAVLYHIIKEEMGKTSQLIENVAWRIAERISNEFETVTSITITVTKCNPPMGAHTDGASITLTFDTHKH